MKATELRIGNLVSKSLKSGAGRTLIAEIGCQDIVRIHDNTGSCNYTPIPLTEESLKRFGFERVAPRSGIASSFIRNGIRIDISNSGNAYYKRILIQSVHKLQNLYFALKDEELPINNLIL